MRESCTTHKVATPYGSHYVHISHIAGRVTGVSISSPGKFANTAVADMLTVLSEAATSVIADIARDGA